MTEVVLPKWILYKMKKTKSQMTAFLVTEKIILLNDFSNKASGSDIVIMISV